MKTVPLTKGEVAIVDDEDYDLVSMFKWSCHINPKRKTKYARTKIGRKTVLMHRIILPHSKSHTDHADGDGLNNQRHNLRPATRVQNGQNRPLQSHSSRFKGVSWNRATKQWTAQIRVNTVLKYLGHFDDEEQAARIYDNAASLYFGEFCKTNKQLGAL